MYRKQCCGKKLPEFFLLTLKKIGKFYVKLGKNFAVLAQLLSLLYVLKILYNEYKQEKIILAENIQSKYENILNLMYTISYIKIRCNKFNVIK